MKRTIAALMAVVLLLSMVGCGKADVAETAHTDDKTLTYVINGDVDNFNPYVNQTINYVSFFTFNCYEPLFHLNEDMEYEMDLAVSAEQLDDVTYQFKLREGVKFHNGESFSAEDVISTIEYVMNPDNGCYKQTYFSNVAQMNADGDYNLTITLSAPTPAFMDALAWLPITCKSADVESQTTMPIGTGAFKFESWTPNDSIKLSKNPEYWDAANIHFDTVTIKPYPDYTVALNGLYAKDVDFITTLSVDNAQSLDTSKGVEVLSAKTSNLVYLFEVGLHNVEAFRDQNVMKAMTLVLDKAAINEYVYAGMGKAATSPFPSGAKYYEAVNTDAYDLEKAKALMAESAYADGFEFEVMVISGDTNSEMACVIWKQELEKLGITMNINICEVSVWLDAYLGRTYDMICNYYSMVGSDPATFCTVILAPYAEYQCKDMPELFEYIETGASSADEEVRSEAYGEIQKIVNEACPSITYVEAPQLAAVVENLEGVTMNGMGHVFLKGATK